MHSDNIILFHTAEELRREAESAAVRGEQSQLYRITKQVYGKYHSAAN